VSRGLIGLDWGTSSLRAYRIDGDGRVIETVMAARGVLQVEPGGFDAVLAEVAGRWLADAPGVPILAAGMIGSRQGWVEVPYARCPIAPQALAEALHPVPTARGRVWIVPGLVCEGAFPDVLRGEETQILGAVHEHPTAGTFLLPGTHSKWVPVRDGRIERFATFMTGELFAVLRQHSILGRLMDGEADDAAAFARGVGQGLDPDPGAGGLLHRLFSVRTLPLRDLLPPAGVASYLSGLLIGSELREAMGSLGLHPGGPAPVLVGGDALVARYVAALALAGLPATRAPADAAARGLYQLAGTAGLLA
jgi:2-dehydro-3-deoxygalactonokinase